MALWSGDGVALPLTLSLTVSIVGLTLRGGGVRLLGRIFIKKKNLKKKKIVKRTAN